MDLHTVSKVPFAGLSASPAPKLAQRQPCWTSTMGEQHSTVLLVAAGREVSGGNGERRGKATGKVEEGKEEKWQEEGERSSPT